MFVIPVLGSGIHELALAREKLADPRVFARG